jgi:hypothetical protein
MVSDREETDSVLIVFNKEGNVFKESIRERDVERVKWEK